MSAELVRETPSEIAGAQFLPGRKLFRRTLQATTRAENDWNFSCNLGACLAIGPVCLPPERLLTS